MRLLTALAAHIEALPGISRDSMDAFADQGKLIPTGLDMGNGLEVGRFRYDAVISIERCPARQAQLMLSVLLVWLAVNDPDRDKRDLDDPVVDVALEDEQTVSVEVSVQFDECLGIVRDDDGPILWDGKRWRINDVPIDTAESLAGMEKA